jgi:ABC transporter substrate binding protein
LGSTLVGVAPNGAAIPDVRGGICEPKGWTPECVMVLDEVGLISYGNDPIDNLRRAATYADRILKGAEPSELPVQVPVTFDMTINLKTAKALGLDVPWFLQQRADQVIE